MTGTLENLIQLLLLLFLLFMLCSMEEALFPRKNQIYEIFLKIYSEFFKYGIIIFHEKVRLCVWVDVCISIEKLKLENKNFC